MPFFKLNAFMGMVWGKVPFFSNIVPFLAFCVLPYFKSRIIPAFENGSVNERTIQYLNLSIIGMQSSKLGIKISQMKNGAD